MENLDPLRQKPDFEKFFEDFQERYAFQVPYDGTRDFYNPEKLERAEGFKMDMKFAWDKIVEPLMKELDALKAKVWTCPICRKDHLMPDRVCDHGNSIYHHGFSISASLLNQKP